MTTLSLKPLNLSNQIQNDTHKLVKIQGAIGDLTNEFINKDIDTIESQTNKIQGFANGITTTIQKVHLYKSQCSKTMSQLENQVNQLNGKIKIYQKQFKNLNKENQFKKQIQINQKKYLAQWEKRIQIAAKIDTDALAKIHIDDRKSKANQVFKWIIVAIYGEPQNKYYWPNFRQQIFVRDEGQDFRERLGKVNASNAKQEQRVKTADLLKNFNQVIASKQLKKADKEIQEIRKVADIFLNCYQISKTIRNLQMQIQKSRQQSRQRDEQAMRWKARAEALQDRIRTNREYWDILSKLESLLEGKIQSYNEKQTTAKDIVQKLKDSGSIGHLEIDVGDEKRDNCECAIY